MELASSDAAAIPFFLKRKEWGRKENRAANCCPLTGVTTLAGDTRLVFMHQPGFPLAYSLE
ncbi:MAG: hypothetical protein DBX57_05290 [Clostridia bacterium]|nr:MAG: hypothetical protein DBX57_05290 [Clostridia bacterium]